MPIAQIADSEELEISVKLSGNSRMLSVRVPKELHEALANRSKQSGHTIPEVVRDALLIFCYAPLLELNIELTQRILDFKPPEEAYEEFKSLAKIAYETKRSMEDILSQLKFNRDCLDKIEGESLRRKRVAEKAMETFKKAMLELKPEPVGGEQLDQ